jgi:signal transduction histidine kinase
MLAMLASIPMTYAAAAHAAPVQALSNAGADSAVWAAAFVGASAALALCAAALSLLLRDLVYACLALCCVMLAVYRTVLFKLATAPETSHGALSVLHYRSAVGALTIATLLVLLHRIARRHDAEAWVPPGFAVLLVAVLGLGAVSLLEESHVAGRLLPWVGMLCGVWIIVFVSWLGARRTAEADREAVCALIVLLLLGLAVGRLPQVPPTAVVSVLGGAHLLTMTTLVSCFALLTLLFVSRPGDRAPPAANSHVERAEALHGLTQIVPQIVHDLRAPLATIAGYVRLMRPTATPEQAGSLRAIEGSVRYQLTLVDQLLHYARAQAGAIVSPPTPTSLSEVLDEVVDATSVLAAENGNRLRYMPSGPLPNQVYMDSTSLRQALFNLLSNAAKYTRQGTIVLAVHSRWFEGKWRVHFIVLDNGVGIAPSQQEIIFEPFRRLHAQREGVGLGLHIARRIVRALGGELRLHSEPDRGSMFSFQLELAGSADEAVTATQRDFEPAEYLRTSPAIAVESPPLHHRTHLLHLARQGQYTEIEQWLEQVAANAAWQPFCMEVRRALDAMDMARIESLARLPGT